MKKTIFILFAILLFFVPLILWPFTSEVFEFNKMVLTYALTTLVVGVWAIRCINERKFIFRRTILDVPILLFLGSQFISTIFSIDFLTSLFGYYSRFNGGLLSTICYSLLYWAFVSNLDAKSALRTLYFVLSSTAIVSIYGILEHFSIDKNIWVQDVQNRIFSTLGQPNWLAAYLVALLPITWSFMIENSKTKILNYKFLIYFSLSILFFWTLIFTKSRSGLLGLSVAALILGGLTIWKESKKLKTILIPAGLIGFSIIIIALTSGTPVTPSLFSLINHTSNQSSSQPQGTALETGGTESGTIRKIVWKGAIDVWAHYPIFGTGVETFAYSYYKFRPAEHNLTSEWDFIYNKAHNEFLNVAANTGTVGLLAYLILIGFSIFQMLKIKNQNLSIALLAGFVSLSVTNFFGFSVVPTQLQFFLFPAFSIVLSTEYAVHSSEKHKISNSQKTAIFFVLCTVSCVLFAIGKYWYTDTLYNKGKNYNGIQKPDLALPYLTQAISLEPSQALYHSEAASSYTAYALAYYHEKNAGKAKQFTDLAISESDKSLTLSPANVNLKRSRFAVFITLSSIDPNYLTYARDVLIDAINSAPTDAKLYYNLGLVYARTGQPGMALSTLKKTIDLKANYGEARLAYALLLIDGKQNTEAKVQLEYLLTNIDPENSLAKQTLEGIK